MSQGRQGCKVTGCQGMKIKDMEAGQRGRVVCHTGGDRDYRHKLLRMGLVKGAEFEVVRVAPMGDPVELELRGFQLSLRKDEADVVEVEAVE